MKVFSFVTVAAAGSLQGSLADDASVNPLGKVFQMINDLKSKINADGEAEEKAYQEYADWCRLTSAATRNEIDTATKQENKLKAKVDELTADLEVGDTKVEDLSGEVAKAEAELKKATAIRKQEAADFSEAEKELMATVDTLERAISVLQRELASGGSFAQIDTSNLNNVLQSLAAITDAAGLDGESKQKLAALLQAREDEDDSGAPAASKYDSHSGGIIDVLEDMKDKAEGQLADLRQTETKSRNSYAMLKQSLDDDIAATTKELNDVKSNNAQDGEEKAAAEGNLEVTKKEKANSLEKESQVHSDCQTVASDHEANVASRVEELKAISQAEQILKETTGGAESRQYSFLQVAAASGMNQRVQLARNEVITMIQRLAKAQHSSALAQLASRISAELKYSQKGAGDPFKKVKGLIDSMIMKLEKEASEEATEKAYCDEQMAKTKAKKGELEDTVSKLTAKIEKAASNSAGLKEDVSELNNELSVLAKEQAEMDKIRRGENKAYLASKKDLELGLSGVRKALSVLRDFYAQDEKEASLVQTTDDDGSQMSSLMQEAATQPAPPQQFEKSAGAGSGLIGMLEVIESDFAKSLAAEDAEESDAASSYEKQTQANKITKAQKEQDAKYKTQEFKALDKSISELEADKATEEQELGAVNEYWAKIKERCIAKPESYEERRKRREAEINGLKEALAALESAALLQVRNRASKRSNLRGDALQTD